MATLNDDEAWRVAMAAARVLRGRVWPVEARDESGQVAGFRGTLATYYEWINVQVYDPNSRAFAALPTSSERRTVDYAAYARETRSALALWTALSRCPGFSARENPAFWLRVLRDVAPSSHGHVSDVPRFFDTPRAVFPRFRLTFQPRDCYDEDQHEDNEAVDWVSAFWRAFFEEPYNETCDARQYVDQVPLSPAERRRRPVPLQVVFRVPMKRTHGPLGSALERHRGFLRTAQALTAKLVTEDVDDHDRGFPIQFVGALMVPRGSMSPREYCEIAKHLQSDNLQVSGLCVDLGEEPLPDAFKLSLEATNVTSLTMNVSKASKESVGSLSMLLASCSRIQTLRLFNAFTSRNPQDRQAQWAELGRAICQSRVQELALERAHLEVSDAAAFRSAFVDLEEQERHLLSVTIKPLVMNGHTTAACTDLVSAIGASLEHLDVSALCLTSSGVDAVLQACPVIRALHVSVADGMENSQVIDKLRRRDCCLAALAVCCPVEAAERIIASLAHQSQDIALADQHLKELRLDVEAFEPATRDALVQMLETNGSLRYFHAKSRTYNATNPLRNDARLLAHHQRQLVRKLPMAHTLAFLSVLGQDAAASQSPSMRALHHFDAGIASEIVGFAGHSVRRLLNCS